MEYIDTLKNIYGETVTVYENSTGNGIVIFEGSREKHTFQTVQKAIDKLYKMGYQF